MSRIHEAIQRAEQERLAGQSAGAAEMAPVLEAAMPTPAMAPAAAAPVSLESPAHSPAAAITYDQLNSQCIRAPWRPDVHRMLFFENNKHQGPGMEEFRTLRARLYQMREKRPLKSILIGSALPGEGKSFVSANLAQVLARQHGRRVLLIDADLRWSRLHDYLGTQSAPGLTDYLRGEADEIAIMQRGPMDNLLFIPGGKPAANPAELVGNGRFKTLLHRLGPVFDWIVVDSPPAVPVSDASRLAEACDGVLLVLMAAQTPFEVAQKARSEFRDKPLLGVILNRVDPKTGYTKYYYSSYGKQGAKGSHKG